jgi:hypothetical protein
MRRPIKVLVGCLSVIVVSCAPGSSPPPLDPEVLEAAAERQLGLQLLDRFERTLDLDRMSVHVITRDGRSVGLRYEYYTPAGDKSFTVGIERTPTGWRADEEDVVAQERRFAR